MSLFLPKKGKSGDNNVVLARIYVYKMQVQTGAPVTLHEDTEKHQSH